MDKHGRFPTINFKNVTLQTNFRSGGLCPLPFRCLSLSEALEEHVELAQEPEGKQEVIFPIGLPNQSTRSFWEDFKKEKQEVTELSAGAVKLWAEKSGFWRGELGGDSNRSSPGASKTRVYGQFTTF